MMFFQTFLRFFEKNLHAHEKTSGKLPGGGLVFSAF